MANENPETSPNEYPEHEKLHAIKDKSQSIGEFLDWLNSEKKIVLGSWYKDAENLNTDLQEMRPVLISSETLLAEFFDIDLKKLEQEKRAILKEMSAKK